MAKNKGKQFEQKFREDFSQIADVNRIYDTEGMRKGISNICDFINYKYPRIYYLEAKSTQGQSIPFTRLTQYDKMIAKKNVFGAVTGFVVWFIDYDKVVFIPITVIERYKQQGKKSINVIKHKDDMIDLPSRKKVVYMDTDYRPILEYRKEENDVRNCN